jgi:hypothetical protein
MQVFEVAGMGSLALTVNIQKSSWSQRQRPHFLAGLGSLRQHNITAIQTSMISSGVLIFLLQI